MSVVAEGKKMTGARHSGICTRFIIRLGKYLEETGSGAVYGPGAGFTLGQKKLWPAISVISSARTPLTGEPLGSWEIAPDLAVEVVSSDDGYNQVMGQVTEYFAAGVKQVWLLTPSCQTVTVYPSPAKSITLFEDEELTSEDLLPGFRCPIRDLFKQPKRA